MRTSTARRSIRHLQSRASAVPSFSSRSTTRNGGYGRPCERPSNCRPSMHWRTRSEAPIVLPRRARRVRSALLFAAAALAELGGAFLVWQAVREGAKPWVGVLGAVALVAYGLLASLQPDPHFGRVLAAYGGVFVCGSLLWGIAIDGFRPDR